MKNQILFLITIIFLSLSIFSCKNQNTLEGDIKPPTDLLSEDSMINILVDVHLADAIVSQTNLVNKEKKDFTYSIYGSVFKKNNLTKTRFETSLAYYSSTPKQLHSIYEKVLAKMSELEGNSIAKEVVAEKSK